MSALEFGFAIGLGIAAAVILIGTIVYAVVGVR